MDNPIIIFGATGLGRAALELFETNGNVVYGFLDDDKTLHGTEIDGISVLGNTSDDGFLKLIGKKCEAFIATDDNKLKQSLVKLLKERRKMMPVNGIHPSALLAKSSEIGHGNFINAGAILGAGSKVGQHCLINSGARIDHSCEIGDFVQIGIGCTISAEVKISDGAFLGSGCTIVQGVRIGKNARVGAGSVVIADVEDNTTVFGNPAQKIEK